MKTDPMLAAKLGSLCVRYNGIVACKRMVSSRQVLQYTPGNFDLEGRGVKWKGWLYDSYSECQL